jgi:hypothetical protein
MVAISSGGRGLSFGSTSGGSGEHLMVGEAWTPPGARAPPSWFVILSARIPAEPAAFQDLRVGYVEARRAQGS